MAREQSAHSAHGDEEKNAEVSAVATRKRSGRAETGSFAQKLGQLIHGRGIRQSALARESGLEPYLISNYMLGKSIPSRINLIAIAKALNVEPDTLLPNPQPPADTALSESPLALVIDVSDPSSATLRVNMRVSLDVGSEIVAILSRFQASTRG